MADPKKLDAEAGFHVLENFGRFNQKNDIYSRAFWDAEIRSEKTERFFETYRTPLKEWKMRTVAKGSWTLSRCIEKVPTSAFRSTRPRR